MLEQLAHILTSTSAISAEICLALGIVLLTTLVAFGKKTSAYRTAAWFLTLVFILLAYAIVSQTDSATLSIFNGLFESTALSTLGKELTLITTLIVLSHIKVMGYDLDTEYYIVLITVVMGLLFLLMANHFLSIFIALETVSICSYILVAMNGNKSNLEAGIKYLIFGGASTAFMLFGMSLFFGITGSMNFSSAAFQSQVLSNPSWAILGALGLTLAGPLFKLSAAPFHIWAPDVYEATPTPLISFLSVAPKIAAVFLIYKFLVQIPVDTGLLLSFVILLSILIGNFAAISQTNAKRMLGYSGIAQAGFILIGLLAFQSSGFQASVFYLAVYIFMSTGSFLLLDMIEKKTGSNEFKAMAGLSQRFIFLSILGLIFMIGLVGLPPSAGFTAKFLVFSSLYEQYSSSGENILLWVLVFGLINTAVSIYYYLKIPYFMFLKKPNEPINDEKLPIVQMAFLTLLAVSVLALFFAPQWIQDALQGIF
ncbi:MAG: NADH-quinone oxidoreductase subunit N [Arcticibacterium sp.]|jgi:NADH-quinone oxidoreductase subunit N